MVGQQKSSLRSFMLQMLKLTPDINPETGVSIRNLCNGGKIKFSMNHVLK